MTDSVSSPLPDRGPVVLAGGSGDLGLRIAACLVARGVVVRALVRPATTNDRRRALGDLGASLVAVDAADHGALVEACRGASVVVSALNGLRPTIIDAQTRLLEAAVAAGVPRFMPSDFSLDYTRTRPGDNRNMDLRREFTAVLDRAPIAATSILNGAFADLLTGQAPIVLRKPRLVLAWGDVDQALDFTTRDDIARFAAAAALDPSAPRVLRVAGSVETPRSLAAIMTALSGRRFRVIRVGGIGTLGALIRIARRVAPQREAVFPVWQGLQYLRDMSSGRGKLHALDNDRYADMAWTTARDVLGP